MSEGKLFDISIIIPAFNEARRLPKFLEEVIKYCNKSKYIYEITVVDDGSKDDTYKRAVEFKGWFPNLRVIKLKRNSGKGYAVRRGFFAARGKIVLFMDADGATPPSQIERNLFYFNKGYDIIVGSRVIKDKDQILKTKILRKIFGGVFNFLIRTILFKDIRDTQCGFKMFRREVIKSLFPKMHIRRYGFDIELLYLAHKMGYKIKEAPVSWEHKKGGKVNLLRDSFLMFVNIFQVKNWHGPLKNS